MDVAPRIMGQYIKVKELDIRVIKMIDMNILKLRNYYILEFIIEYSNIVYFWSEQ